MNHRIQHTIDISAPPGRVWEATIDVGDAPSFTPTLQSVELLDPEPLSVGSRARVKQPLQSAKIWTVDVLEHHERFVWSTRWLGVKMTASHDLAPSPSGTTNTLTVDFEGRAASLLGLLVRRPVRRAIAAENQGLKESIEAGIGLAS